MTALQGAKAEAAKAHESPIGVHSAARPRAKRALAAATPSSAQPASTPAAAAEGSPSYFNTYFRPAGGAQTTKKSRPSPTSRRGTTPGFGRSGGRGGRGSDGGGVTAAAAADRDSTHSFPPAPDSPFRRGGGSETPGQPASFWVGERFGIGAGSGAKDRSDSVAVPGWATFRALVGRIFEDGDTDHNGTLSATELRELLGQHADDLGA